MLGHTSTCSHLKILYSSHYAYGIVFIKIKMGVSQFPSVHIDYRSIICKIDLFSPTISSQHRQICMCKVKKIQIYGLNGINLSRIFDFALVVKYSEIPKRAFQVIRSATMCYLAKFTKLICVIKYWFFLRKYIFFKLHIYIIASFICVHAVGFGDNVASFYSDPFCVLLAIILEHRFSPTTLYQHMHIIIAECARLNNSNIEH